MNTTYRLALRMAGDAGLRRVVHSSCILLLALVSAGAMAIDSNYPRYRMVDLGPKAVPTGSWGTSVQLNNRGDVIAQRSTGVPDPFDPICLNDCFVWTGVVGQTNGVVTDLGALPGANNSAPVWISEAGLIAGGSQNGSIDPYTDFPEFRAVLWNQDRNIVDLGTLGGNSSLAFAVNSRGQVVGVALNAIEEDPELASAIAPFPAATQARAFLWQKGSMQDLGTLGGNDAAAVAVNERGQIVGFSYTSTTPTDDGNFTVHPFLYENGTMRDLGSLGGTTAIPGSLGLGGGTRVLNESGQVIGTSSLPGTNLQHAFLWSNGKMIDLGTLGGSTSDAVAINNKGQVVGRARVTDTPFVRHAFLWEDGQMTDLGAPAPCTRSTANSINSANQIVGSLGGCADNSDSAFYVEKGKPMVDLNTLITPPSNVHLDEAWNINDRGEIFGSGYAPDGSTRAVLLLPIPGR